HDRIVSLQFFYEQRHIVEAVDMECVINRVNNKFAQFREIFVLKPLENSSSIFCSVHLYQRKLRAKILAGFLLNAISMNQAVDNFSHHASIEQNQTVAQVCRKIHVSSCDCICNTSCKQHCHQTRIVTNLSNSNFTILVD